MSRISDIKETLTLCYNNKCNRSMIYDAIKKLLIVEEELKILRKRDFDEIWYKNSKLDYTLNQLADQDAIPEPIYNS